MLTIHEIAHTYIHTQITTHTQKNNFRISQRIVSCGI